MGTISLSSMKKEHENMSAHKVVRALSRESRVQQQILDQIFSTVVNVIPYGKKSA